MTRALCWLQLSAQGGISYEVLYKLSGQQGRGRRGVPQVPTHRQVGMPELFAAQYAKHLQIKRHDDGQRHPASGE
jgi:hypothetical protein